MINLVCKRCGRRFVTGKNQMLICNKSCKLKGKEDACTCLSAIKDFKVILETKGAKEENGR